MVPCFVSCLCRTPSAEEAALGLAFSAQLECLTVCGCVHEYSIRGGHRTAWEQVPGRRD